MKLKTVIVLLVGGALGAAVGAGVGYLSSCAGGA